jgi:hypothetical protein
MTMELYASGFNAWNQLRFGNNLVEEPYDLWHFKKVFKDEIAEIWRASFSSTLGKSYKETLAILFQHSILSF